MNMMCGVNFIERQDEVRFEVSSLKFELHEILFAVYVVWIFSNLCVKQDQCFPFASLSRKMVIFQTEWQNQGCLYFFFYGHYIKIITKNPLEIYNISSG